MPGLLKGLLACAEAAADAAAALGDAVLVLLGLLLNSPACLLP